MPALRPTQFSRALLQAPSPLRPLLLTPTTAQPSRSYHSYEEDTTPFYSPSESAILSASLTQVPTHGFTLDSLRLGARDAGFRDASTNLFPQREFELVLWHLRSQRLGLDGKVQFPVKEGEKPMGVGKKVRSLVLERLRGNVETDVVGRWQEALALMSLAGNIPPSVKELWLLADEIWFLSGDLAVDASWYSKRATLSSIYAATEVFQTTDQSTERRDTEQFLDRRLEEARVLGTSWRNVKEWALFQGQAGVNLARSLGARI